MAILSTEMSPYPSNKSTWIEKHSVKIRFGTVVGSLICALLYALLRKSPSTGSPDEMMVYGIRWLEAAMIVTFIVSLVAFMTFLINGLKHIKTKIQILAAIITFLLSFGLAIVFSLQICINLMSFYVLLRFLIFLAGIVTIVDAWIGLDDSVLELDAICFAILLVTYLIHGGVQGEFVVGFHAGVTAFQLIFVNLAFNPMTYYEAVYK